MRITTLILALLFSLFSFSQKQDRIGPIDSGTSEPMYEVPSIASKIGGTPEAVLHNKTGIIIDDLKDLYQSIDNLLANNDLIEKLGKQAQQRAIKDFNWKKVTQNYLSLINN